MTKQHGRSHEGDFQKGWGEEQRTLDGSTDPFLSLKEKLICLFYKLFQGTEKDGKLSDPHSKSRITLNQSAGQTPLAWTRRGKSLR